MGDKKNGKKVVGIAMAALMIASIFAMIAPASVARDPPPPVQPRTNATYYLEPDDSSALGKCENTTVQVWINSSIPFYGGVFTITTDASCGDIEIGSYVGNTTYFNSHTVYKDTGSVLKVGYVQFPFTERSAGVYHVGNFTVHCNSTICCKTNLNFTLGIPNTYISNTTVPPGDYIVGADNGTFECLMPAPNITSSAPSSPVTDYSGAARTFNITIDQPVNVSWLINGTVVKDSEKGVTDASYTNTSAVVGTWNVSAIVENANGTDMETWIWNVIAPPVLVNEFLANPSTGDEWIELYNPTGEDISLDGWTIEDGAGNSLGDLSGKTLPANGYLVFNFSNKLNNKGDIIYLNTSTAIVDKVAYGNWDDGNIGDNAPAPGDDESAGRYPNGVDTNNDSADFRVFDAPTPGAPNTILIPPTTPLLIFGWVVNYSDGSPVNNPTITITNLNTSEVFAAETNATSNYYQLVLATGADVNATEILQFNVTSPDGSQSNITNHTIKQDEVNFGGLFNFNITLALGGVHDINVSTDYYPEGNGIKIFCNGSLIPPGQNLTIGDSYTIRSRIVNDGGFNETVNVTIKVTNGTGIAVFQESFSKIVNVGGYKDAYRTWDTSGLPPGNYNITVNASIPIDDDWSNNERARQVTLALPAAPTITDWYNNITKDNSTEITINESECVFFNASADQPIDVWSWFVDDVNQSHNFDNFSYCGWTVNGTYYVRVNATNANGTSNTITWTVTVEDITPPAKVQNLMNSTPTVTAVDLWWAANTEPDLVGYKVYQNGSLLGTTANTYYNVTGLSQGTTYEFNVSAYDDNGLEGENATVTVTTATYPAPEITSFAPATTSVSNNESESRIFNVTIDQTVNVSWYINGTVVQTNESVTEASYTNTSAVAGYWNVSAVATNENGTAMQTWWWTVNDTTPPAVTDWAPTGTGVAITTNITATFSEPMNESTLNDETVIVKNSTGSAIAGAVTYDSATRTVTFDPTANLEYNETYNVTVTTGVADLAGNHLVAHKTWNFTTRSEVMEATISIGNASANFGDATILPIMIYNATNAGVVDVYLTYNQSVVMVTAVAGGDFDIMIPNLEHNATGLVRIGAFQTYNPGLNGTVIIANITLKAVGSTGQSSTLNISVNEFKDATPHGNKIPYRVSNGTFSVNIPPVADAGPDQTVLVNETVQFNGSGSCDPDGEIVSYYWDFGDGTNATGVAPTHVYTTNGTYTVTLTVTDNNRATDNDTCNITVNIPPVADAGPDQTVLVNETVQFNGSGSCDPDGEIVSYYWDFGDGTTAAGVTPTHNYTVNGTFIVTLSVTDNHNATDEDTCNITVYWNGDANGDGKVELFDAMYLAKSVLEITGFEAVDIASDVDGDGEVTLHDAMYLAKHVLKINGFEELK